MKRLLTRKSILLALSLVLVLVAYGAWQFSQRDADAEATEAPGSLLLANTARTVGALQQKVRRGNPDASTYTRLGYAYLQGARETGNGSYNDKAADAFTDALVQNPRSYEAMNGMGNVQLTNHQFRKALKWGRKSLEVNPDKAFTYGILVDAHIELGQYDQAIEAAQAMVNLRPDLGSYSRISYIRELMGDTEGAIKAMRMAVSASSGQLEQAIWCRVYLGHLFFHQGDLKAAEKHYQIALQRLPNYGHALAGLARVRMAQERFDRAVALYKEAADVFPIPEFTIALGDAYAAAGQPDKAQAQHEHAIEALEEERASGMDVDGELALLLLEQGQDLKRALELAQGAYERRPTVKNTSILAWAHHKNEHHQEALRRTKESLKLGTKKAAFYYRAGAIAAAAGKTQKSRDYLQQAVDINPYATAAEQARKQLASLQQTAAR